MSPAILLAAALMLHLAGRAAAFCSPFKVDSFVYALAAYKLYDGDVSIDDLVPDKPPGQALLTGWVYRLPGVSASRLSLLPIESAFMLAGYTVFFMLAGRLWGSRLAAALTLFVVLAHNTYNALDCATDGFNLGENYLLPPTMLAVYAHWAVRGTARRGLLRGFGLGAALMIKQTAVGLVLALIVHDMWSLRERSRRVPALAGWTALGMLAGFTPVVGFLLWRGWLTEHVGHLMSYSGGHMSWMPIELPSGFNLIPLWPMAWWAVLGAGAMLHARRRESESAVAPRGSLPVFVLCWLAIELVILWAMNKLCLHYYQQIVVPAALAAGLAIGRLRAAAICSRTARFAIWRWVAVVSGVLVFRAAMPMLAETGKRAHTFDPRAEVAAFSNWLETWSPGEAAIHAPRKERP